MMDFTIDTYKKLLFALQDKRYSFSTFEDYLNKKIKDKTIILRHDVDDLPENSLRFARIQKELDIQSTYFFRIVSSSYHKPIIKEIVSLGHEIGYHYEDLTSSKGNYEKAILSFQENLKKLRELYPVKTICMHGSPLSKWDSKLLWTKYKYTDFGIIGEPYFDIDFSKMLYLTDTGRRWDGDKVSVRDRISESNLFNSKEKLMKHTFHSSNEIIHAANNNELPNHIMFTFHPQRWHSNGLLWSKEFIFQNFKNTIKRTFFVK